MVRRRVILCGALTLVVGQNSDIAFIGAARQAAHWPLALKFVGQERSNLTCWYGGRGPRRRHIVIGGGRPGGGPSSGDGLYYLGQCRLSGFGNNLCVGRRRMVCRRLDRRFVCDWAGLSD